MKRFYLSLLAAAWSVMSTPNVNAAPPTYTATDLGSFGGSQIWAYAVNASGQVTGGSSAAPTGDFHAFLFTTGGLSDLRNEPSWSVGRALNNNGVVVGSVEVTSGRFHAARFSGGAVEVLPTLGGTISYAMGINSGGDIVGGSARPSGAPEHAFLYSGAAMADLGVLGGAFSYASAINNAGQIVGVSNYEFGGYSTHAFLYAGGVMTDLGTLGGANSSAYGINQAGVIVGSASLAGTPEQRAFVYQGGVMTDLGAGPNSEAYAINSSGDIVGSVGVGVTSPFLFSDGVIYNLNDLLVPGTGITNLRFETPGQRINDAGQIVVEGYSQELGQMRAYLLTPTPEPASAVLLLGGAALLGLRRRR